MKKILLILTLSITTLTNANKVSQTDLPSFFQEKNIANLTAYPNPLTTKTTITFYSDKTQYAVFRVKNLLGKTVYSDKLLSKPGKNNLIFYKEKLASGMYIYSVQTDSGIVSKRLVIK